MLKIRRALLTASDKAGIVDLAKALVQAGTELVATGKTASILREAGLSVTPIETITGSPEAFKGRMKTLSFNVCSGILFRRGDADDEQDLKKLKIVPIDCVVVNFYPFEKAAAKEGVSRPELIEEVDIGGPTLVRAAAKNAPDVLVLTHPGQYPAVIEQLKKQGGVSPDLSHSCAQSAWDRILDYDKAIARELGGKKLLKLRYGENPHQQANLSFDADTSPIQWDLKLTPAELSYNNILDVSAGYGLASDLTQLRSSSSGVVIIKHNNPCGVALAGDQLTALKHAWAGDPVSAFGGVVVFNRPLESATAAWLAERFVDVVVAPGLTPEDPALQTLKGKRKNLKAVSVRSWNLVPAQMTVAVPGGELIQTNDLGVDDPLKSMTKANWPAEKNLLGRFGISVTRSLKSNAVALVHEDPRSGVMRLVGAGQGQPNRVEALEKLAFPRARKFFAEPPEFAQNEIKGSLEECVLVSDAFFPFRDTVDIAAKAGIRWIIQPGGSLKDGDSVAACDQYGIAMAFTGIRHFRH
ncbi:bifunctional phosphoribosylaminoimidazolecarboxamide formyltransferase/IMP cyclohydrolase [bacterium]|jgi:phosphoribosylaminoimidazolecarboxamide formyltransferase/IMP cyclohydrolase|nr:bifunctional phosphoribosylaminoimidazolecarboxamide formyltransferase/IMP cyclohydrolase [bacterium]